MSAIARLLFLTLCLLALRPVPAPAQEDGSRQYTLMLRGVPLGQALEELVKVSEIDLIYSSSLAEGKVVYCNARNLRVEAILRCILNHTGLDFVRTSAGTYVVIDALRARARLGHLAGRVIDGTTGEPLPNANVLLADASVGTTTNEGGYFQFSSLISGKHRILVTYVGYETAVDSVQILGGETMLAEIALEPGTLALETIVIDGLVERLPSRGLGAPALRGEGSPVAGTFGVADVAQTAAKVAGVSIRHPIAELHIQGSGAGDHLTLLDEVPVRDPVTLGRYLSAFSPLAIRRVRVHKAGYGAAYGGHLSGVVRIDHDVGGGGRPDLGLLIDPLSISGRLRGRFPIDDSRWADAMVSVRTAMWNMYRDPGLEELLDRWNAIDPILIGGWLGEKVTTYSVLARRHRPEVSFSDLHAAARMRLSPFRSLDLSAYRAGNRLASDLTALNSDGMGETNRVLMTQDDYEWTNWAAQARHTWLVSARSAASLQVRGSHHTSMYRYLSDYRDVPLDASPDDLDRLAAGLDPATYGVLGSDEEHAIREFAAEAGFDHSFTPQSSIELSFEALHIESRFAFGNQYIAPFSHERKAWQLASHAEAQWSLGLRTLIEPGIRLTLLPARRSVYAEPRLAIRHDRPAGNLGSLALKLAGGVYRQYIPSYVLTSSGSTSMVPYMRFWLPLDETLAPPRSYHVSAEALLTSNRNWSFGVEAFGKWQHRLLAFDYAGLADRSPSGQLWMLAGDLPQSEFVVAGSGRALGGNARVEYRDSRWAVEMQYAFTKSEHRFDNRFDGRRHPAPWDEPHRVTGSVSFAVTKAVSLFADGEASWQRSWAFRRAYYDYLAVSESGFSAPPFSFDHPSDAILPAYRSVNAGMAFDFDMRPVTVQVRGAILNLFNRRNVYDWSLQEFDGAYEIVPRTLPGRRPALSIKLVY